MTPNPKSPQAVDVHVGARVRTRRMSIGMSQQKLGEALGITFQQIQKYEKGTNRVSCSMLVGIAAALKTSPAWFFEDLDVPTGGIDRDIAALDAGAVRIAVEASVLTPPQRDAVRSVIRAIREPAGLAATAEAA